MRLFKKLRRKLTHLSDQQVDRINRAYLFALESHRDQKRSTGEPYITHPVAVACLLADLDMDAETIMAALLHDVIEDTDATQAIVADQFGDTVAELVEGVSKLTQIEFVSRAERQAVNFRKMLLAMSKDIRVVLVKLADRLHNMRTLGTLSNHKKRRVAQETLDIFAPIAKRLGMRRFSVELEELGFACAYPKRYAILKESVHNARGNRKKVLSVIEKNLRLGLSDSHLVHFELMGREKHIYSIYRKMLKKKLHFSDIMDVYAFRIIVDDLNACYQVLGIIHGLYKPVTERFKDYIAIPKVNGYQSLHTTLFGPYGLPIEIQVRTKQMDQFASSGIASHWLYKTDDMAQWGEQPLKAQKWAQKLLDLQAGAGDSIGFLESVKVDLFPNEIYVFTPKGKILELPVQATAIDFAYAVHTDVGNHCVAVKIDRELMPLSTVLASGQTVEVVTASYGCPNSVWLEFVVTSKARNGIRQFIKNQRYSDSVRLGRELLKVSLGHFSIALKRVPASVIETLLVELKLEKPHTLFFDIALGHRLAPIVAQHIADLLSDHAIIPEEESDSDQPAEALAIQGTEGVLLAYAPCCYPIPGDVIIGILNQGKGLRVHRDDCDSILGNTSAQVVPLCWDDHVTGEFTVAVSLIMANHKGALAQVSLAFSDADANIENITFSHQDGLYSGVVFTLGVHSRIHLAKVMKSLRAVDAVVKIVRGMPQA
jgi:guanosine-3',5'-bis(diphosphate) 3'-pyrophosphohydrolase